MNIINTFGNFCTAEYNIIYHIRFYIKKKLLILYLRDNIIYIYFYNRFSDNYF